jgi:hydroxyacylglutathione hydrolase
MMFFHRFYNEEIAQASFLIGCNASGTAVVVDPTRDLQQYMDLASREKLKIVAVTETHIHADYVSGSRELASAVGAKLYLSKEGGTDWQYAYAAKDGAILIGDGDEIAIGKIRLRAIHTPGHTPEHLSFLLVDGAATDEAIGVLSGDFIFAGDVGRPDLLEVAAGVKDTMAESAATLYCSIKAFDAQPDRLLIWPGHGSGSACGKALGGVPVTSLGYERLTNPALRFKTKDAFIGDVLAGQPEPPRYFARMKKVNREGPAPASHLMKIPKLWSIQPDATLIDVRSWGESALDHVPGSVAIPIGNAFAKWAGSLIGPSEAVQIIAKSEAQAMLAQRTMVMIGLEGSVGWIPWNEVAAQSVHPQILETDHILDFVDSRTFLDVRGTSELEEGRLEESIHIPLVFLSDQIEQLRGKRLLVHCAGGGRATIAASYLQRQGIDAIAVDAEFAQLARVVQSRSKVKSGVV